MSVYYYEIGCDFLNTLHRRTIIPKQLQPCADSMPGVWCSQQEEWNADSHFLDVCPDEVIWTARMSKSFVVGCLGRIKVDESIGFVSLKDFQQLGGVCPKLAKAMRKEARRIGIEPDDWLFVLGHIPACQWLSAEYFTGEGWEVASDICWRNRGEGDTASPNGPR